MSFSLFKHAMPKHDSDKYDRLSNLLLTPSQSSASQSTQSETDDELNVCFGATFNNDGIVTDLDIVG